MRKLLVISAVAALGVLGTFGTSFASSGPNASGTFHDGPYTGSSPDSGTCGNNWAFDLYARNFTVTLPANPDGSYNVSEKFSKGHFSTFAGDSPGGCDTNPGGTLTEGISGSLKGSESGTVTNGTFDPNGSCVRNGDGQCTTSGWIAGFFGPSAQFNVDKFKFVYNSGDGSLTMSHWVNADASQGGNSGDISN